MNEPAGILGNLEKKIRDILKDCHGCGMCSQVGSHIPFREDGLVPEQGTPTPKCPPLTRYKFISYSARGRLWLTAAHFYESLLVTEDIVKVSYTCQTCGLCDELCFMSKVPAFRLLREEISRQELAPAFNKKAEENVRRFNNPFGEPFKNRTSWAEGLDLRKKGDILYFAGCWSSYKTPDVTKASIGILKAAGYDPTYLAEKEMCCGNYSLWYGDKKTARAKARGVLKAIESSGAKEAVFSCPHCLRTFRQDYPLMFGELPFKTKHITEIIAESIDKGRLDFKNKLNIKVTYHDPCRLGRHLGIYDEPRKVIQALPGIELVEMKRNRQWAWCCGSGASGDILFAFPGYAHWVANERLKEASENANVLVTACAQCYYHFKNTLKSSNMAIGIYDLPILAAKAMDLA